MFLLVLAHPGCPGQNPKSCKTVVCVCVCARACVCVCVCVTALFSVHANLLDLELVNSCYFYIRNHSLINCSLRKVYF